MTIDVIIRSYFRDFSWLRLALKSIDVFLSGYRRVLLILPESSADRWSDAWAPRGLSLQLRACEDYQNDYLGQQVSKLYADELSDADYLVHLDADCVFLKPAKIERDFFNDGKPTHIYRKKSQRPPVDGWRTSVHRVLGIRTEMEFMVAMPAIYPRDIYAALRRVIANRTGQDPKAFVLSQRPDQISEFSLLGAYAYRFMRSQFAWIDADQARLDDWPCTQFWGRGCSPSDIVSRLPRCLR